MCSFIEGGEPVNLVVSNTVQSSYHLLSFTVTSTADQYMYPAVYCSARFSSILD